MSFDTPRGTRGIATPGFLTPFFKLFNKYSARQIRKSGKAFGTMPALVLTTVGAKSGQERTSPVAYFPAGDGR